MKKALLSFVCLMLALVSLPACSNQSKNVEPSLHELQAICELATLECYYHNTAKFESSKQILWWDAKKELWIEYSGIVKAGVDLSQLTISTEGDTVTLSIPKATVLDYKVDPDSLTEDSYIVASSGLGSGSISAEEQHEALKCAQEDMKQNASSDKVLLAQAEQRAKELCEQYIHQVGEQTGRAYTIKWASNSTPAAVSDSSAPEASS